MPGPFCKLLNPARYIACGWDLTTESIGRHYWVTFFKRHLATILSQARAEPESARRCTEEFYTVFDAFAANPSAYERVTILTLDQWRDDILRRHGFVDAFAELKARENAAALPLLPRVCGELDELSGPEQFQAVILGIFAGNIFDMGAGATAAAFLKSGPDFFQTRRDIRPRPWLIDHFDALSRRILHAPPHKKIIFFIDNAGSDFLLGVVPMVRWLCRRGSRVILAANEFPTLNDMTIDDLRLWWPKILAAEPSLADMPIELVSTGTAEPLIDLGEVSDELNAQAADADLVILEGMGRGVESNLDAEFSCDALNLAMIKDQAVADRHCGQLFDVVCRFWPAPAKL